MAEKTAQFEARKEDHLRIALSEQVQTRHLSDLGSIRLLHEALPDLDFSEISLKTEILGHASSAPFFISSMTAGHPKGVPVNATLAEAAEQKGWAMGVGSQRRELSDTGASEEWRALRKKHPRLMLMGNIGLTQLISQPLEQVLRLMDSLEPIGFFVHLNPLQEALQPEGTPQFRGGLSALEKFCKLSPVPVVVKETGCGFSPGTLLKLKNTGIAAVDVAGLGGTHWGRVEGARSAPEQALYRVAETFADWGVPTAQSVVWAQAVLGKRAVWASGGVRHGLDAAKLLCLGASQVGFAQPLLKAALKGVDELVKEMNVLEQELKTALFCVGLRTPQELGPQQIWREELS